MHPSASTTSLTPWYSKHSLPLLLLMVLLSRLVFAFIVWKINGPSGFISRDTDSYLQPARSLLHGSFLANGSFSLQGMPETFRTPGYPLLLAPAVFFGHLVLIAVFENLLFAICSAWLLWQIATELMHDSRTAIWAVIFYCFEPIGFLNCLKLLTETAFTTLFLAFVWILVRFLREPTYSKLGLAALTLGAATYVRPVSLYLGLFGVPLFFLFLRTLPWPKRISWAALFPVLFALTLSPWILRNSSVAGLNSFSSIPDSNLYFYAAAAVEAKLHHRNFADVQKEWGIDPPYYFQIHEEQRAWSQGKIARFWRREATKTLGAHLPTYSLLHARGCAMVMFNPAISEVLRDLGIYPNFDSPISTKLEQGILPTIGWLLQEYPLAALLLPALLIQLLLYYWLGFAGLRRLPPDTRAFFAGLIVYFILISGIPGSSARYRAPFMPLICISAGVAVTQWRKSRKPVAIEPAMC
jgi:4-amino-4-deoxy-L-arabinose transferase-like glycosyltransferase